MAFDDQGIFKEETYNQPQTGGMAGVNILNQVQSYGNYRRAREAEILKTILALREAGQAGSDISQEPAGAEAMGVLGAPADQVQSAWERSPQMQFQRGAQGMDPEKTTPEALWKLGATTGATTPEKSINEGVALFGQKQKQLKDDDANNKAVASAGEKAFTRFSNQTDDRGKAAEQTKAYIRANFQLSNEQLARFDDWVDSMAGAVGGKLGAQAVEIGSKTDLNKVKAWSLREKTPHQIKSMDAKTFAEGALGALREQHTINAGMDAAGTKPQNASDLSKHLNVIETIHARLLIDPVAANTAKGKETIDAYAKEIAETKAKLVLANAGTAPAAGAKAAPAGAAPVETKESIRDLFRAGKITREQAKARIAALTAAPDAAAK